MFSKSALGSLVNVVSRAWHFQLVNSCNDGTAADDDGVTAHKVTFRHAAATGKWVLIHNGHTVLTGTTPITNRSFDVPFMIDGKYDAVVHASGKQGLGYSHTLTAKGTALVEIKRAATETLSVGERLPDEVAITDTRQMTVEGKDVVLYQLCVQTTGASSVVVERRFSEFVTLAALLKSVKDVSTAPLPTLPSRILSPFVDQHSATFVGERRTALQRYLRDLLANPRVRHYAEFLLFLGLDPVTGLPLHGGVKNLPFYSDDEGNDEGFPP